MTTTTNSQTLLSNKVSKQRGFFDLGLSIALLTIFGATAYAIERNKDDNANIEQPQITRAKIQPAPLDQLQ